jgi:hypothetical protein
MRKALKKMLVNCTNTILDFYARAFYHVHPIKDDEGNLIGHEWYGIRSGGGQVWFDPVCAEDNELSDDDSVPDDGLQT